MNKSGILSSAVIMLVAALMVAAGPLWAGFAEEAALEGAQIFEQSANFHPLQIERNKDNESPAPYSPAIVPYVNFLASAKTGPVDYVMELFERADIVILCERFHPESTQYDFILKLVSDPRFVQKVGRVFTEVGTSSFRPYVREFLHAADLSEDDINKRLSHIYQNAQWMGVWEKSNYYDFLRNVYQLNKTLSEGRKVDVIPSDVPFSWEGMTAQKYQEFEQKSLNNRDRIMAEQIASAFDGSWGSSDQRKKALVIMNYRHAFNDFQFADGKKGDNTGRYLFERYPGRVANVLINTVVPLPGSTDKKTVIGLFQDGKWDAAFMVGGNPNVGFDMDGSPFGEDRFDLFPHRPSDVKYKGVFDGFIFYFPLEAHKHKTGNPGLVDEGFAPVLMERTKIMGMGEESLENIREWCRELATAHVRSYADFDPKFDLGEAEKWLSIPPNRTHP